MVWLYNHDGKTLVNTNNLVSITCNKCEGLTKWHIQGWTLNDNEAFLLRVCDIQEDADDAMNSIYERMDKEARFEEINDTLKEIRNCITGYR
jgi:hypothetical protein